MIESLKSQIEMRRAKKNITVKDLETLSGLKANSVLNLLIGKVKSPKIDTVEKLAIFFDCSVDELLGYKADMSYTDVQDVALFKVCILSCLEYFELKENTFVPNEFFDFVQKVYMYSLENNLDQPDQGYIMGLGEKER